jgi:hypothetical protein
MANDDQQQQQQQQQRKTPAEQQAEQPAFNFAQSSPYLIAQDDYVYEAKAPPKPFEQKTGQDSQAGGMGSQFEIVSSALNKNV